MRVPGSEIADDIMNQRVPLCKICNAQPPPAAAPATTKAGKKKKGKKQKDGWDSDESDFDEPDLPLYPPGIMKASGCASSAASRAHST